MSRLSLAMLVAASSVSANGVAGPDGGSAVSGRAEGVVPLSLGGEVGSSGTADAGEQATLAPLQHGDTALEPRAAPASIPITSSSPSTSSLSRSFTSTYSSLLDSLASSANDLASSAISPSLSRHLQGVPGTGITSSTEARALQAYLDCTSSQGEWVYDPSGAHLATHGAGLTVHKQEGRYAACEKRFYKGREVGESDAEWDVRESLKWRWSPSAECADLAPSSLASSAARSDLNPLSRTRFCRLLAHKSTLLLGDTTQYSLHDLILDWTTIEPQSCYGDLYCKEHALCGEILRRKGGEGVEDWEDDERVYHRLPLPPGAGRAKEKRALNETASKAGPDFASHSLDHDHPHTHSSPSSLAKRQSSHSPSYGTLLRYRRTDGLRPATAYTLPTYKHPYTGIREINQQWLADARRSDVVILTKSPLPLPLKGHNGTFDARVYAVLEDEDATAEEKALALLEAAADVTQTVWLPELLEALRAIRTPPSPADQLVVYRSGWRTQADCAASSLPSESSTPLAASSAGDGPPPHPSQPSLASLLFRPSAAGGDEKSLLPPSIVFHNLQLLFQNRLARTAVLPAFGVPYLDLETPLSIWRSGMVGSSAAAPLVASSGPGGAQVVLSSPGPGQGLRSPASGDCSRYCFPSPGLAVEEFFLGAMARIFEAGWAGSREREREWVGNDGFRNLRERLAEREGGGE
ncbi:hypothetical protein JCM10213_001070 [Rhodosporidiobolus nylandii]